MAASDPPFVPSPPPTEPPPGPDRRHLRLVLEYDGSDFAGWQRQANGPSIQATLEDALAVLLGHPTIVRGAGRTDAGVHALGQVASFKTTTSIPPLGVLRGLNTQLPRSIAVAAVDEVPDGFDARRWARGKHYRYQVWTREARGALVDRFTWHVFQRLDDEAMRAAAAHLVGEHDFSAFRAADCDRRNPVRAVRRLDLTRSADGHLLAFDLEGTAFLKHMVRIVVGSLVDVGLGRKPPAWIAEVLAARDRTRAGRTAPAKGLTLVAVRYPDPLVAPTYAPPDPAPNPA